MQAVLYSEDKVTDVAAWVCPTEDIYFLGRMMAMRTLDDSAMQLLRNHYLPGLFTDSKMNTDGIMTMLKFSDIL